MEKKRFRNDKAKQSKAVVDFVWLHYGRYNTDTRHHKFSPNTYFGDEKLFFKVFSFVFFLLAAWIRFKCDHRPTQIPNAVYPRFDENRKHFQYVFVWLVHTFLLVDHLYFNLFYF